MKLFIAFFVVILATFSVVVIAGEITSPPKRVAAESGEQVTYSSKILEWIK